MRGEKLKFAKRACAKLVKHLDAHDVLHFISYDHAVLTVFSNGDLSEEGKENLKEQIQAVRPGGATNLFGGLQRAAELLQPLDTSTRGDLLVLATALSVASKR